jgi:hypothetical protein
MPPSNGPSQREREIVAEELAVPLRRLRREAGDPTYERIAEDSGLCRNTVDNAFNARRLVRWRTVEAIVVALGGDAARWRERWVTARGRLDALKAPAAVPEPAVPEPAVPEPPVAAPVVVRRAPRRLLAALVGAATVFGWGMAVAVLAFGPMDGEASAARDRTGTGSVPIAQVRPVAGSPEYAQCSDRDRSVLSEPGRVRGGRPRGKLRPGDRFVVTSKTAYWRYGRVPGDPERQGWVLAGYLCRTGG